MFDHSSTAQEGLFVIVELKLFATLVAVIVEHMARQ
jgi:hypothetical protein